MTTKAQQRKKRGSNPESALTNAIVKALVARGFVAWRNNAGTIKIGDRIFRGAPTGSFDVVVILPPRGRHCEIEVKLPGKKLRPAQVVWMAEMLPLGVRVARVDSISVAVKLVEGWMEEESGPAVNYAVNPDRIKAKAARARKA